MKNTLTLIALLLSLTTLAQEPVTRAEQLAEIDVKMQRVQRFLAEQHLDGLLLSSVNNFAWLTAGLGDNHILLTDPVGVASLLVLKDGRRYVVAPNTEIGHIQDEELAGLGYQAVTYNWYDPADARERAIRNVATGAPAAGAPAAGVATPGTSGRALTIGTDVAASSATFRYVAGTFRPLRYELTDSELKKYRWVCRQSAEAVATVCRTIRPGMTDRQIEALTIGECKRRGLMPTVVLIGVDERLQQYYHYPPVGATLRRHAFVNICARRWGLTASVGRYVHFGQPPADLLAQMRKSAEICARMQHATRPGARANAIFAQTKTWYAEQGLPGGWQPIHVGGGIGYAEREWVASDQSTEVIGPRMAYAWNPFARAALSFDTVWLKPGTATTSDHLENLTLLPDWPTLNVVVDGQPYRMPGLLVR